MIRFAIHRPIATAMAYACAAILGIAAWQRLPIELLPDTALPRLTIRAWWVGASPQTTEAFLTAPLEAAVQQVRGVEKVSSVSLERQGAGEAEVTAEFRRDVDMEFARLDLSERLAALERELPASTHGPIVEPYVPEQFREQHRPFLQFTLAGPHTVHALAAHIDRVIAPELRQLRGVADVAVHGLHERVVEIEVDPLAANSFGLRPELVRDRISSMEIVREAGTVREKGRVVTVAIRERGTSLADVLALPVLTDRDRLVTLGDIAVVRDTYQPPRSHHRINGLPAVSFEVFKEAGTNTLALADAVKAGIGALERSLPPGTRLILDHDESGAIRTQFADLGWRTALSALVIFVVLLISLRSYRAAAIAFATMAFAILVTLNAVYLAGYTLNVLTLMGLAMGFGILVDVAIVVLENIYRHCERGVSADAASERGTREVMLALFASTVSTMVVFIPFVYLQGELRVYYTPLALVTVLTQAASLLVAFTFIPATAARLLRYGTRWRVRGDDPTSVGRIARRGYDGLLRASLAGPWIAIVLATAALGASWYAFDKAVPRGVLWRGWWNDETYLLLQITLPRGEELERTDELARYFERELSRYEGIDRFVTWVYPQSARIRVTFSDSVLRTPTPLVMKEELTALSFQFGGAEVRVYGFGPSFYGGGGAPPTYAITVRGYNYPTVQTIAEDLGRRLTRFSRIHDVDVNASGRWYERDKATEVVVRLDRQRLAHHALTARDAAAYVAAAAGGSSGPEATVRIGEEEASLVVKVAGSDTLDLLGLREVLIPGRAGAGVRLGDVATIEEREIMGRVVREDQQYRRDVAYEFRGPTKLGDRVLEAVITSTALPVGYHLEGKEEWQWAAEDASQLYGVLLIALLLIYLVTAALFESLRQPLCVLLTVPMALVGVFAVFVLTGASFTREAYIGVIMMAGVVVNNAILLVDRINQLRRTDVLPLHEAIVVGSMHRARPILMTSACTVLGLLPLVIASESPDANIWNALGYALIGGLTSSTLLVLTVTPALYLLLERRKARHGLQERAA